ncbi:MAG TPA: hypothetical protein VEH29_17230 [Acidimicrobiales bacterium]|nr:hypothetical protein [Acidimicrobiales bacterium]
MGVLHLRCQVHHAQGFPRPGIANWNGGAGKNAKSRGKVLAPLDSGGSVCRECGAYGVRADIAFSISEAGCQHHTVKSSENVPVDDSPVEDLGSVIAQHEADSSCRQIFGNAVKHRLGGAFETAIGFNVPLVRDVKAISLHP